MESSQIKLTRDELYERVWSTPLSKLCREFGLTDRGLAKVCRRHNVPRPGLGYWRRIELGLTVIKTPLPHEDRSPLIYFGKPDKPKPPALISSLPAILVPDRLNDPHPIISATKAHRKVPLSERYRADRTNVLYLRISASSLPRALRLMNTIFRTLEGRGHSIRLSENGVPIAAIKGEEVKFALSEFGKRVPYEWNNPKFKRTQNELGNQLLPTGNLSFSIDAYAGDERRNWQDGKKSRIEDYLATILNSFEIFAQALAVRRVEREIEQIESRKREQKRYKERQREEYLSQQLEMWERVEKIQRYVNALEKGIIIFDGDRSKWIEWVKRYARTGAGVYQHRYSDLLEDL